MHICLSEGSNAFQPLHQAIFRQHRLLYYRVIYLCKIGVSLVVLQYKTYQVSVLKLLKFLIFFFVLSLLPIACRVSTSVVTIKPSVLETRQEYYVITMEYRLGFLPSLLYTEFNCYYGCGNTTEL
jgi:hypothetical protein